MFDIINTVLLGCILVIQLLFIVPIEDAKIVLPTLFIIAMGTISGLSWLYYPEYFPVIALTVLTITFAAGSIVSLLYHLENRRKIKAAEAEYAAKVARGEIRPYKPFPTMPLPPRPKNIKNEIKNAIMPWVELTIAVMVLIGIWGYLWWRDEINYPIGLLEFVILLAAVCSLFAIRVIRKHRREKKRSADVKDVQSSAQPLGAAAHGTEMEPRTPTRPS